MTRTLGALIALTLSSTALVAVAQTPPPPPPAEAKTQGTAFVEAAGKSDMFEIESSKIALQKTADPKIKAFANMMIKDHMKTTAAVKAAAKKAGMTPPPPVADAGLTTSLDELRAATGKDFDRVYLAQQMPAHQAALDLMTSYSTGGDQPALKAAAKSAVPIVQHHLDMVTKMQGGTAAM